MEEHKFFLEENRSVMSTNVDGNIGIDLTMKMKPLPNDNLSETLSLLEQYNAERDACEKYRISINVNPICTNILFNYKTEIVKNEGSDNTMFLYDGGTNGSFKRSTDATNAYNTTDTIDHLQAIRDTEYSHPDLGNFVYHCGADIFNNHMTRSINFAHVNGCAKGTDHEDVFNTIQDFLRDARGEIVKDVIGVTYKRGDSITEMHLYEYDTITSFKEAFLTKCKEKDGWWGFYNPGNIEIPNSLTTNSKTINRMMAKNKPCEFIDLYPDRSLYSFIPKFNKHRKRIEKNWDYCITYPYTNDYEMVNTIFGGENGEMRANIKNMGDGESYIQCSSYCRHNLKVGDYVKFYYYIDIKEDSEDKKVMLPFPINVKVLSIGNANGLKKDRIFNVKYSDIASIYENLVENGCFFKKVSNGDECLYYFRKFKKIKTLDDTELKSSINKVAFGNNIYGDDVAQIIFTDDINIEGLLDNNGYPVSEVFLTIIKRNAGYEKWYKEWNGNEGTKYQGYKDEDIEFSHCFGEVTSGIDFGEIEEEPYDYNIHYMHNLKPATEDYQDANGWWNLTLSAWGETTLHQPKCIESGITVDSMDEFYGDIIEYDYSRAKETVISEVYHRFNTAQRESSNNAFRSIYDDEITSDDYDVYENGNNKGFKIATYYLNNLYSNTTGATATGTTYGNVSPEGYYYNPHFRLAVRVKSDDYSTSEAKIIPYDFISKTSYDGKQEVKISVNDGETYYRGDFMALFNKENQHTIWGEITYVNGSEITLTTNDEEIKRAAKEEFNPNSLIRKYCILWSPNNVPIYAKFSLSSMAFVWDPIISPSNMRRDEELYDTTFANGRFYIEKNINFFLRRQDPFGKYGLSVPMYLNGEKYNLKTKQFVIQDRKPLDNSIKLYDVLNNSDVCY